MVRRKGKCRQHGNFKIMDIGTTVGFWTEYSLEITSKMFEDTYTATVYGLQLSLLEAVKRFSKKSVEVIFILMLRRM